VRSRIDARRAQVDARDDWRNDRCRLARNRYRWWLKRNLSRAVTIVLFGNLRVDDVVFSRPSVKAINKAGSGVPQKPMSNMPFVMGSVVRPL